MYDKTQAAARAVAKVANAGSVVAFAPAIKEAV
jgi:hypothetical protein